MGREGVGRERRKRWRKQGKFRCTDQTITVHVRRGGGTIMDMVLCWEEEERENRQSTFFLFLIETHTTGQTGPTALTPSSHP